MLRKCDGLCGDNTPHTHDLRAYGRWHYVIRFKVMDALFADRRPQPPVGVEIGGAPWFADYAADWKTAYPQYEISSCYVRDEKGFWVWVTNTPLFDRDWFEKQGWQFPAAWITGPSRKFYCVGRDKISTIVSLPPKEGGSSVPKDEAW